MLNVLLQSLRFDILNVEFCKLDSSWDYRDIVSPFTRIYLITNGGGVLTCNDKKTALKAGYLYLVPSFTRSSYYCPDYLEQYYIHVMHKIDNALGVFDLLHFRHTLKASDTDYLLFERLLKLNPDKGLRDKNPDNYNNKPELFDIAKPREIADKPGFIESEGIVLQIFSRFMTNKTTETYINLSSNSRFAEVIHFINNNLSKSLTVSMLAEKVCLNPDYFSRLFLKLTGMRPIDYINKKRIETSQYMIHTTNKTLAEIAYETGFENYSYFSRVFRRITDISPQRFKEESRNHPYKGSK